MNVRGFSLLEVVVALTIASLALVGLFRAAGSGLVASDTAVRAEDAMECAQSQLAIFVKSGLVGPAELTGNDRDGCHWQLRAWLIGRHPGSDDANVPRISISQQAERAAVGLYEIEVKVSWAGAAGRDRSVVLATRRLGAAPTAE
jgi:prepilin-type N-terminal cleavage/methylation domain-containing protein